MKVKDFNNWKRVVFNDRVILKSDMEYMSAEQKENLLNTEVATATGPAAGDYTNLYIW